jgi:hypothetical protein
MEEVKLSCRCGKVQGRITNAKPSSGNRLVCYCKDCRKFAKQFNLGEGILDEFGGTEVLQLAPSNVKIDQGIEYIACMRLTPKGMNRWYTSCCDTPIGTVPKPTIPFVGVMRTFIAPEQSLEHAFGPVLGTVYSEQAEDKLGNNPNLPKSSKLALAKVAGQTLIWKVSGKGQPNPFFNSEGRTIIKPTILQS